MFNKLIIVSSLLLSVSAFAQSDLQGDIALVQSGKAYEIGYDAYESYDKGPKLPRQLENQVRSFVHGCLIFRQTTSHPTATNGIPVVNAQTTLRQVPGCSDELTVQPLAPQKTSNAFGGILRFRGQTIYFIAVTGFNIDGDEDGIYFYSKDGRRIAKYGTMDFDDGNALSALYNTFAKTR